MLANEEATPSIEDTINEMFSGSDTSDDEAINEPIDPPETDADDGKSDENGSEEAPSKGEALTVAEPALAAPNSWSKELKNDFAALPPKVQSYIHQREQEQAKAISKLGNEAHAARNLGQVYAEYNSVIQQSGQSPVEYTKTMLAAADYLNRDPVQGLQWLAGQYGIDLGQALNGSQDPNMQVMLQKNHALEQQLAEISQKINSRETTEYDAQLTTVAASVEKFTQENPLFEELEDKVSEVIPMIRSQYGNLAPMDLLKKAYDFALYNSPEHRQKAVDQEIAARNKAQEAKASKARSASQLNGTGSGATTQPLSSYDSLDDVIRASWRELGGR